MSYIQSLTALVLNSGGVMNINALLDMRGVAFKNIVELRSWEDASAALRLSRENMTTRTALLENPGILLLTADAANPGAEEICQTVKRQFPDIFTVIVLREEQAAVFEADAAFVDGLILWPFTGEELHEKLKQILDARIQIGMTQQSGTLQSAGSMPHIGDKIADYLVLDIIDVWRNSAVYKVIDTVTKEIYALKLLTAYSETAKEAFQRETAILSELDHPNLIKFRGCGEFYARPYILMEYIDGADLEDYLLINGPPALDTFLRIAFELAQGLEALHAHGVVHQDIKLSNIIVSKDSKSVVLTDFGLSGLHGSVIEDGKELLLEGTPVYMAPELLNGHGKPSVASDIYSFGAAMYHFLGGNPPHSWTEDTKSEDKLLYRPKPLRLFRSEIPEALDTFITEQCMAEDLSKRPGSMTEILHRLSSIRDNLNSSGDVDRHCVLIVDDEPMILQTVGMILRKTPYELLTAKSAEEALGIFNSGKKIHLLMTDYNMTGGMNGIQLSLKVQERSPETVRIVFSGQADTETVIAAINAGHVYKFLIKNWTNDELRHTVALALNYYDIQARNRKLERMLTERNNELYQANVELGKRVAERTHELEEANNTVRRQYSGMAQAFFKLMELQYESLSDHARRIGVFAKKLAEKASAAPAAGADIEMAGYLHDIGKLPLSFESNSSLSPEEYRILMRKHPAIGANILQDIPGFESIVQSIRSHHENCDGSGYPDGLMSDSICFGAKVIAIVDRFDRLISPENDPIIRKFQFASEQLQKLAESGQIDPVLCGLFLESVAKEQYDSFKNSNHFNS